MKKICLLMMLLSGLLLPAALKASSGVEDMQGLALKHIKIPFYNDQKLQLLVFSDVGERNGRLMQSGKTLLDVLLDNINVDKIPDGWRTRLYPLDSPLDKVLEFWKNRYQISDAVIFTDTCAIDQANSEVTGNNPVSLRAPVFDLDGIGFRADFANQVIEINSDVKIVVRSSDADPREILAGKIKKPQPYKVITATSDSLRLDRKNSEFMLIGNVKVVDGRNTLTCNRLTVYLNAGEDDKKDAGKKMPGDDIRDEKAMLSGVKRVLADGNVLLIQRPEDPAKNATELQTSQSEHLEYDVKRGIIVLSGDEKYPVLTRGIDTQLTGKRIELLRHEDKMFVMQDCRVKSIVRDNRGMISFVRSITSDRANFDGKSNVANFHGHVLALDQKNSLSSGSLRAHLVPDSKTSSHRLELLFASGKVKITSRSEKISGNGRKTVDVSTISSELAELNYLKNKLVFYRDVKVRGNSASLDCNRLDFFLADRKDSSGINRISGAPLAAGMEGVTKTITRMIAVGKVSMISDKKDRLTTDMLTLVFRDLPEGGKPSPGMIQAGGVQLIKIFCDGSVVAASKGDIRGSRQQRTLKADNAMSDLLADYSEFHGNVAFSDGQTQIKCRDMYIFTAASPVAVSGADTAAKAPKKLSEEEMLDADPFEMDMGEDSVPARIAVSDGQDLKRIVCKKEVEISRSGKDNKLQRAGGDQAVYTVNTREIVLSAEPPNRPWLRSEGRKQFCDIIRCDMATEDLRGIGNVVVMPE